MSESALRPRGTARLALASFRRRRLVLLIWPLVLVALFAAANSIGGDFRQNFGLPGSESQATADRLAETGFEVSGGAEGQVVVAAEDVRADAVAEPFQRVLDRIPAVVDGVTVRGPYEDPTGRQISSDGTIAYATVDLGDATFSEVQARAVEVVEVVSAEPGWPADVQVEFGGLAVEDPEFGSEAVGLVAAIVILLLAFGSLLAMGLPIATALIGIGCGVAIVTAATRWIDIPDFGPATVAMLGLGVGIDYALFIVTRYREELADGAGLEQALVRTMSTAGRSVVFAGTTVVTSLLGLLVVGLDDVRSLALAAAAGVGFVMAASLTLLPALLGFVGNNIDRFGLPHRARLASGPVERSVFFRWSRLLQARPVAVTVSALAILVLLAAPVTQLRLGLTDASTRPVTDTTRRAHDLLVDGFGAGTTAPLILATALPSDPEARTEALDALETTLGTDAGVEAISPPLLSDDGDTALHIVVPTTGSQDEATAELVRRLRSDTLQSELDGTGTDVLIGGVAAATIDFAAHNARVLPWFIAVVLLLSFVVLMVLFRSILVPLKAVLVNLLSVGAAYGVVVAVFQWGWAGELFRLGEPGPIEAWVPMMLFAIVFGLSIDYEVFLLSRIKERFQLTGDNTTAVADGLARSARLIAAAAAIMVCVFGAFAFSADRGLQMLGLGLAVAIAVDATLVRLVLVPATMELLGNRNWWLPAWLGRLLPEAQVEDDQPQQAPVGV
jgi:putative drug exporter of the RND superfamily